MINFIISDDSKSSQEVKKIIENYMMNYDIEVKFHLFENYNNFINNIINIQGYKVLILNNNKEIGFKECDYLRNKLDDWNSIIIITTNQNELKYEVIDKRLFIFDCICKTSLFEKTLIEDLKHIIKNYDSRCGCLKFEINRVVKIIDYNNIDMIIKEKSSKKCLIHSSFGIYNVAESLLSISERLDKRFIKINRGCLINVDKISEFDLVNNKITLKCGIVSFDISRDQKKKLYNYFTKTKLKTNS